jgi:hypothetical protein
VAAGRPRRIQVGDTLTSVPCPTDGVTPANPPFHRTTAVLTRILDRMDVDNRAIMMMPIGFAVRSGADAALRMRLVASGRLHDILSLSSSTFALVTDGATPVLVIGAPMLGLPITWAAEIPAWGSASVADAALGGMTRRPPRC